MTVRSARQDALLLRRMTTTALSMYSFVHCTLCTAYNDRPTNCHYGMERLVAYRYANNESSEVCGIIKPGRRVKIKGHRW